MRRETGQQEGISHVLPLTSFWAKSIPPLALSKAASRLTLAHPASTIRPPCRPPGPAPNRDANEVVLPRIKSAAKAMRKAKRATARNRQRRSQLRTALKRVRAATTTQEAAAAYRTAAQLLDRAGRKNLIHRNAAARQKSRLAKAVAAVKK